MVPGIRFQPPEVELSAEMRWVLRRAFGPPDRRPPRVDDIDPETVADLARQYSLTERISSRVPLEVLERELGEVAARRLREATTRSAALSIVVEQVCREIGEVRSELGFPVVILKGAALLLAERIVPGSRGMCDVDVLAPKEGVERLQSALVARGCSALDVPESEHQLQRLTHPSGLGIEVHKMIPGVRLAGRTSATVFELIERGYVQPAPGLKDGCHLPDDDVMIAHLIVHGIAQHGMSPQAYPMVRMFADLQDLQFDEAALAAFLDGGYAWIAGDVSREEIEAVAELVWRFEAGDDPQEVAADDQGAATLLRHLVAGTMDEGYSQSMRFRSLTVGPKDVGFLRGLVQTLRGALLPTRAQIDMIYGAPRTKLGYWGWRLWRPFDLLVRSARYGREWLRQRIRLKG